MLWAAQRGHRSKGWRSLLGPLKESDNKYMKIRNWACDTRVDFLFCVLALFAGRAGVCSVRSRLCSVEREKGGSSRANKAFAGRREIGSIMISQIYICQPITVNSAFYCLLIVGTSANL